MFSSWHPLEASQLSSRSLTSWSRCIAGHCCGAQPTKVSPWLSFQPRECPGSQVRIIGIRPLYYFALLGPLNYHLNLPCPVQGGDFKLGSFHSLWYDGFFWSLCTVMGERIIRMIFFYPLCYKTQKVSETYIVSLEHIIFVSLTSKQSHWFGLVFA